MATYYDQSVLDALLNAIKNGCNTNGKVVLISDYTQNDTWATVDGNILAEATITSGDFTGPTASGVDQQLTFSGKAGTATATDATPTDLHIALIDDSIVYAVTNETSDQPINSGNPVTFPAFYMQASQPTQA